MIYFGFNCFYESLSRHFSFYFILYVQIALFVFPQRFLYSNIVCLFASGHSLNILAKLMRSLQKVVLYNIKQFRKVYGNILAIYLCNTVKNEYLKIF